MLFTHALAPHSRKHDIGLGLALCNPPRGEGPQVTRMISDPAGVTPATHTE